MTLPETRLKELYIYLYRQGKLIPIIDNPEFVKPGERISGKISDGNKDFFLALTAKRLEWGDFLVFSGQKLERLPVVPQSDKAIQGYQNLLIADQVKIRMENPYE